MTAHAARAPGPPTAALFGAVMALVALTVAFATLGVYLGRDAGGAAWFVAWLLSLARRRGIRGTPRPFVLYRTVSWLLLALPAAGVALILLRIPALYTLWSLLGRALLRLRGGRLQSIASRRQGRGDSARGGHTHRRSQHPLFFLQILGTRS